MGSGPLPSVYAIEVAGDSPTAWLRFEEQTSATVAIDAVNGVLVPQTGDAPAFQTAGLLPFDSGKGVALDEGSDTRFQTSNPTVAMVGVDGFTFEFLFQKDGVPSEGRDVFQARGDNPLNSVGMIMNTNGTVLAFMTYFDGTLGLSSAFNTSNLCDGDPHHIVMRWTGSGNAPSVWVDGVDETTSASGDTFVANMQTFTIGNNVFGGSGGGDSIGGVFDEFAWYSRALTDAEIVAHADAVFAPWNGDTTGERVNKVLDAIGVPESERNVDNGVSTLQSAAIEGQSALDHMRQVERTEFGALFMTPDGKVRFISRHNKWRPPYSEPVATLSDEGDAVEYTALRFDYGDQLIRNQVTVGYDNGLSFTADSTGSQDSFHVQSYNLTGLIGDVDSEAVDYANYLKNRYDQPLLRAQGVTLMPQKDPATYFPVALGLDLQYTVNLKRTPQSVGDTIDIDYTVEGIRHHIEPKLWRTELQLSPADTPGAFILDSTSQGLLGENALGF